MRRKPDASSSFCPFYALFYATGAATAQVFRSAMSSATAGKPSRSASAIVAAPVSGYHLLKIDGYSGTKGVPLGDRIVSRPFTVGGHRWKIDYHPNGFNAASADHISFFLRLDESVPRAVKAQHKFRFADEVEEQAPPSLTSATVNEFTTQTGWGTWEFVKREELEKSRHLKEDCFVIRCDIVVVSEYRVEDLPETAAAAAAAPKFVSVPPSDLSQHLGDLLKTGKGADVAFEVGGETFAAHRCVLASRSPVFSAELLGAMQEGDTACVVRVDDLEARAFKALLCFAYTDSLPETREEEEEEEEEEDVMCQHLLVAADRYNMERLKLVCEEKLCKHILVGTVATILALAEQHHCDGLKKACFHFLRSPANLRAVVASDNFDHLSRSCPSVVKELIVMSSSAP